MYLINQIALLLALAGLIGFLAGWFFGRCTCAHGGLKAELDNTAKRADAAERELGLLRQTRAVAKPAEDQRLDAAESRIAALEADLDRANAAAEARLDQARADLAFCRKRVETLEAELKRAGSAPSAPPAAAAPLMAAPPAAAPAGFTASPLARYSPDALEAAVMAAGEGVRPPALAAPEGAADDLKAIGGVGPALEQWLNAHGIFHYRQIASLQASGLAWLARNLPNFGSRVYRENWVEQAARLAHGQATGA